MDARELQFGNNKMQAYSSQLYLMKKQYSSLQVQSTLRKKGQFNENY